LVKQGWFFPGKTSVELSDKSVSITGLNIIEGRKLEISVDRPPAAGTTVSFETRSEFYFHSGRAEIS